MFFYVIKSIFTGLVFGYIYGYLFIQRSKKLYKKAQITNLDAQDQNNFKRNKIKTILLNIFFSLFNHILLIALLVFLIIKFEFNAPLAIIFLLFSFWIYILKAKK